MSLNVDKKAIAVKAARKFIKRIVPIERGHKELIGLRADLLDWLKAFFFDFDYNELVSLLNDANDTNNLMDIDFLSIIPQTGNIIDLINNYFNGSLLLKRLSKKLINHSYGRSQGCGEHLLRLFFSDVIRSKRSDIKIGNTIIEIKKDGVINPGNINNGPDIRVLNQVNMSAKSGPIKRGEVPFLNKAIDIKNKEGYDNAVHYLSDIFNTLYPWLIDSRKPATVFLDKGREELNKLLQVEVYNQYAKHTGFEFMFVINEHLEYSIIPNVISSFDNYGNLNISPIKLVRGKDNNSASDGYFVLGIKGDRNEKTWRSR